MAERKACNAVAAVSCAAGRCGKSSNEHIVCKFLPRPSTALDPTLARDRGVNEKTLDCGSRSQACPRLSTNPQACAQRFALKQPRDAGFRSKRYFSCGNFR